MDRLDILIAARDLLLSPGFYQPNSTGCGVTALCRVQGWTEDAPGWTRDVPNKMRPAFYVDEVCKRLFGMSITKVSDVMGLDAIVLAFDVAINDYPDHAPKEPHDTTSQTNTDRRSCLAH